MRAASPGILWAEGAALFLLALYPARRLAIVMGEVASGMHRARESTASFAATLRRLAELATTPQVRRELERAATEFEQAINATNNATQSVLGNVELGLDLRIDAVQHQLAELTAQVHALAAQVHELAGVLRSLPHPPPITEGGDDAG